MPKVMLIEDDKTMVDLLTTLLEIEGYEVATFTGGADVLSCIQQENPEVIIIAAMGSEAKSGLLEWKKYPELRAVRDNRLFILDPEIVCHLTPRLGEELRKIATLLHPELFPAGKKNTGEKREL